MSFVPVEISIENLQDDAINLAINHLSEKIQTQDPTHLETEIIYGGITNSLIKIHNQHIKNTEILIRVFGKNTQQVIDRNTQEEAETYLAKHQIGKTIHLYFKNGQVESWTPGRSLESQEMRYPFTAQRIAKAVAKLHALPPVDFLSHQGESKLWHTLFSWIKSCREYKNEHADPRARLFDFDEIERELRLLKAEADKYECPLVVSHMDLLSGNILEDKNGDIAFIDFEYTCMAEFAFDLANHFNEYPGFGADWKDLPGDEEMTWFVEHYQRGLPEGHAVRGWSKERVLGAVKVFQLVSHYFWGLWAVIQAYNSTVDFDYYTYGFRRLSAAFTNELRGDMLPSTCNNVEHYCD